MFEREGRPAIQSLRGHRARPFAIAAACALLAATAAAAAVVPSPAGASRAAPARPATPAAPAAAPKAGAFAPPRWLPLRHDLDGGPVTVGCTYGSHGSAFGYECGGHHDRWALDFLADAGTPVYAAGAGYATDLTGQPGGSGFGNVVQVDHGGGDTTTYAHLSKVLVPAGGAWVDQDTELGLVGSTGSSSANHLHYERRTLAPRASIDPGPLLACHGGEVVRYPDVAGPRSWQGLQWGQISVTSDGTSCATEEGVQLPPVWEKTNFGAATASAARDGARPTGWDELLPAEDPLAAALDRLLTPAG